MIKKTSWNLALTVVSILALPHATTANTDLSPSFGPQKTTSWVSSDFLKVQKNKALSALRVFYSDHLAVAETWANEIRNQTSYIIIKASSIPKVNAQSSVCRTIMAPAVSIATVSKYNQNDTSRSEQSETSAAVRNEILKPIRKSIADLSRMVANDMDPQLQIANAKCFQLNLVNWAEAKALTQMESTDAYLTRDRFMSEIALNLISSQKIHPMNRISQDKIFEWLGSVATSTIEFYQYRAGNKVKINNHRYWAGLAVGSIGYAIASDKFKNWGTRSYQIGVCQVDATGYLPLELSRGDLALDYHVYALRPLQAFASLASDYGDSVDGKCGDGLKRLRSQTLASMKDASAINALTGVMQEVGAKEKSYSKPLQLTSLGLD